MIANDSQLWPDGRCRFDSTTHRISSLTSLANRFAINCPLFGQPNRFYLDKQIYVDGE